jgi:hypothetical protein
VLVAACGAMGSDEMDSQAIAVGSGLPAGTMIEEAAYEYEEAEYAAAEDADYADEGFAGESTAGGELAAAQAKRKLIFRANLDLEVEDTRAAIDDARRFVEARGGFVESAEIYESGLGTAASIVLRVPQESYEETLGHLRELAVEVLSDSSGRTDVTRQHADMDARLANLNAAEAELRDMMEMVRETGGEAEDVLAVFRQLTEIRGEIESLQAQLDTLSEQVALSTIHVEFEPVPAGPAEVARGWRPGLVFRRARTDLVSALQSVTDALIYFTVALAPVLLILAVLFAIVVWVIRAIRRLFRRERTGTEE